MFQTTNQCMYIYICYIISIYIYIYIYMYHNGMIHICIVEYPYQCVYTGVCVYTYTYTKWVKDKYHPSNQTCGGHFTSYQIRPSIGSTKKGQLGNLLDFFLVPSDRSYLLNPQTRIIWVCVSINHQDHQGIWGKHAIQTIPVMA